MLKLYTFLIIFFICCGTLFPCSSAIISGRVTSDGRPILWKHRDARNDENDIRHFTGEKYDFTGLVNTDDTTGTQVWMGANDAGFAIANTNSYNLDKGGYKGPMDQEGYFMKEALGRCGSLSDFEDMLDETSGKRGTLTDFVVMDAKGGAAYYEATPFTYERFDATDPKTAPAGYLIRTNFGFSGKTGAGSGYIRYQACEDVFHWGRLHGEISPKFVLQKGSRSLKNPVLKTDLYLMDRPESASMTEYVLLRDYIVRSSSVSAMVIQGVKPGEDPSLTTMWTIPAFPLTTPCIPVWTATGNTLPKSIVSNNGEASLLSENSLELKSRCFPLKVRDGRDYLDLAAILNDKENGILQRLIPAEDEIIAAANELLEQWSEDGFDPEQAKRFYNEIDRFIADFYEEMEVNPLPPARMP